MRFSHSNYSNGNICPLISLFARDANASYEPLLVWDFSYHQDTEKIFDCPLISLFARDANASYEPLLIWDFTYHHDTEKIFDNNC